jgi:hypothetical protein
MASYWIVAAAVVCTAWPSSSKAYVVNQDGTGARASAEEMIQASDPSSASSIPAKTQASADIARPGMTAVANVPAASADEQSRDSYLLIELSQSLKAGKLKPGDRIKAEVSQDVVSHGRIIVPVETRLVGHVTEVCVRDGESAESRLGFVFDTLRLKHFNEIKIQAVVQAVAPPVQRRSRVDEPSQMPPLLDNVRQPGMGGSSRGRGSLVPPDAMGSPTPAILQVPFAGEQSRDSRSANGSSAIRSPAGGKQSLSVGTPQGVTGLKGLSLTPGATPSTPGPVVISKAGNVKLEAGTQILLRVMSAETAQAPGK